MRKSVFICSALICLAGSGFAQSVTLTSPNGGEIWYLESTRSVTWTYSGIPDTAFIKLVLFKDGTKIGNIAQNVLIRAGSFGWRIGNYEGGAAAAGGGYQIRIRDMDGKYPFDESNGTFTIKEKTNPANLPDFGMRNIRYEAPDLKADVHNFGAAYNGPLRVRVVFPELSYDKDTIFPAKALNSNEDRPLTLICPSWPQAKECLKCEIFVDPTHQVPESEEGNNHFQGMLCNPVHDLSFITHGEDAVDVPHGQYVINAEDRVKIFCRMRRVGERIERSWMLRLIVSYTPQQPAFEPYKFFSHKEWTFQDFGDEKNVEWFFNPPKRGYYKYEWVLDANHDIVESDEKNNSVSDSFFVWEKR